jgi:hypothetical protein
MNQIKRRAVETDYQYWQSNAPIVPANLFAAG